MPKGIARQNIAGRASIARKPIASVYATQSEQTAATSPQQFPPGSYTFTPTVSGRWKFVLCGGGGYVSPDGGGSGAYAEITKFLTTGQTVALVTGRGANTDAAGTDSTATFPDGTVVTAGAASGNTGGVATGGDVNLDGSDGGLDIDSSAGGNGLGTGGGAGGPGTGVNIYGGGAGAPANLPFRGGAGGSGQNVATGRSPGGGCASGAYPGKISGGDGQIIAFLASS